MPYDTRIIEGENRNKLEIIMDDAVVNEYHYHGEPEDNSFLRDYWWIEYELEKAYAKGLGDGRKGL